MNNQTKALIKNIYINSDTGSLLPSSVPVGSYLSHLKSDFACLKSKVGIFNLYNLSIHLASHKLVSQKYCG